MLLINEQRVSTRPRSGFCTSVDLSLDTKSDTPVVIRFIERGPALDEAAVRRQLAFHRRAAGHPHIAQLLVRNPYVSPELLAGFVHFSCQPNSFLLVCLG